MHSSHVPSSNMVPTMYNAYVQTTLLFGSEVFRDATLYHWVGGFQVSTNHGAIVFNGQVQENPNMS
jgi:hypothetical protein